MCELGDVGYVRQGTFHKIFNAAQGPQSAPISKASTIAQALRTETQYPDAPTSPMQPVETHQSASPGFGMAQDDGNNARDKTPEAHGLNVSAAMMGMPGNIPSRGSSRSPPPQSPPSSRRSSLTGFFPRHSSPGSASADGGPPLPLMMETDIPRIFDMGPRMSSNYHSIGITLGAHAHATGVPLGATLTFESAGGDGALLVARDPVQRHLLQHVGVLKAYLKAHRRYIFETYGQAEDIELDELILVYGQDCTSDWAVAVTLAANVGNRVEFEIFSAAKAGVWGNWKTTCTASQRGPHRPGNSDKDQVQPMDVDFGVTNGNLTMGASAGPTANLTTTVNLADPSVSLQAQQPAPAAGVQSTADVNPNLTPKMPNWTWEANKGPVSVNQSIVLRRITAKSKLGLNIFPTKMRAAAGPSRDGQDGRRDDAGMSMTSNASGEEMIEDPLDMLHEYILSHADDKATVSIASDHDASQLCKRVLLDFWPTIPRNERTASTFKRCMWAMAKRTTDVTVDADGFATIAFGAKHENGSTRRVSCSSGKHVQKLVTPSTPSSPELPRRASIACARSQGRQTPDSPCSPRTVEALHQELSFNQSFSPRFAQRA